ASVSGAQVTIDLTAVANARKIVLTLFGVSDGVTTNDVDVPMGVLLGDSNGDGVVNSADATITRNRSGQATDATNVRSDYNIDGFINAADSTIVRARSGDFIPVAVVGEPSDFLKHPR
ncbi:MAG: dockerin type I domain-containing protein, partial [Verrucomicrobiota bacterium]|nr:dockerin type I domain-containing protein [Verrucomicrobiota bacterium]